MKCPFTLQHAARLPDNVQLQVQPEKDIIDIRFHRLLEAVESFKHAAPSRCYPDTLAAKPILEFRHLPQTLVPGHPTPNKHEVLQAYIYIYLVYQLDETSAMALWVFMVHLRGQQACNKVQDQGLFLLLAVSGRKALLISWIPQPLVFALGVCKQEVQTTPETSPICHRIDDIERSLRFLRIEFMHISVGLNKKTVSARV